MSARLTDIDRRQAERLERHAELLALLAHPAMQAAFRETSQALRARAQAARLRHG